ncbi:MAG: H-NS histone family protein [Zoogloeaceae bacterium]|nr:H-NS histone family protein [Zoogloeaceae bacterium]
MVELADYSLEDLIELLARVRTEVQVREAGNGAAATSPGDGDVEGGQPSGEDEANETLEAHDELSDDDSDDDQAPTTAAADLTPPEPPPPPPPPPIKYMHPSNRQLTWDGEGPQPAWIGIWLYTGGTLYALEVAAEKLRPRPRPHFPVLPDAPANSPPSNKPRRFRRGRTPR